ncbi:uncharacterized protein B0H18DRAFT_1027436 [Fomitopsis serialis]|uniref:uncharacterized protein n=1 Tax=Fomitopsis serialis TaxID=139415 RepID=UPI0020083B59|nr:uncharacterized protein B0H18DRAFT_1027436 [Neoantrodia serialis]KAH9919520.1 hypothetical protein B0H18DRAFT_1027436 [Neoantrodia serialis]
MMTNCADTTYRYNIALSDFLRWNPEVSSTCNNLQLAVRGYCFFCLSSLTALSQAYCVQNSPACNNVYTVVSGDSCSNIESSYGLTDAQLHTLNPWLDSSCGQY